MRFDHFDASAADDFLLPDGTRELEIVGVKEVLTKHDGRPKTIVELRDVDREYDKASKFLDPQDKRDHRAAMELLAALGLAPDTEIDASLVGRRVMVTTARAVAKSTGETKVYVNRFAAASSDAAAKEKPAEKPARKTAAAKTLGDDDIPF